MCLLLNQKLDFCAKSRLVIMEYLVLDFTPRYFIMDALEKYCAEGYEHSSFSIFRLGFEDISYITCYNCNTMLPCVDMECDFIVMNGSRNIQRFCSV